MAVYTVGAGTDDCYRRLTDPIWSLTSEYIAVGYNTGTNKQWGGGMRFTNILIPQGAIITSAHLTVQANATRADVEVNSRISAEDVDDAVTFADNAAAFDARWANRTEARVDWDNIEPFTAGEDYDSPDISAVIKEIVDRPGWNSGQDIVIFWEDFEDRSDAEALHMRDAKAFEHADNAPPELVIEYREPGGLENKSANMGVEMVAGGLI